MSDRLVPHGAGLVPGRCRSPRARAGSTSGRCRSRPGRREIEVEHRDRLGRADRVVVGLGHEAHAVAEPHALGPRGDRAVEHLGVRAVRELRRGSGARRSRTHPSRSARRRPPARACAGTRDARCRRPTAGRPGSRRTGRSAFRASLLEPERSRNAARTAADPNLPVLGQPGSHRRLSRTRRRKSHGEIRRPDGPGDRGIVGIGAACAGRLLGEGAAVMGADLNEPAAPPAGADPRGGRSGPSTSAMRTPCQPRSREGVASASGGWTVS